MSSDVFKEVKSDSVNIVILKVRLSKRNGMLYPDLQISNNKADDKQRIGKYGMMWLKFMHEWNYDRYIEIRMNGKLISFAHKINDEAYEMINSHIGYVNSIERLAAEDNVIKDFVLKVR